MACSRAPEPRTNILTGTGYPARRPPRTHAVTHVRGRRSLASAAVTVGTAVHRRLVAVVDPGPQKGGEPEQPGTGHEGAQKSDGGGAIGQYQAGDSGGGDTESGEDPIPAHGLGG